MSTVNADIMSRAEDLFPSELLNDLDSISFISDKGAFLFNNHSIYEQKFEDELQLEAQHNLLCIQDYIFGQNRWVYDNPDFDRKVIFCIGILYSYKLKDKLEDLFPTNRFLIHCWYNYRNRPFFETKVTFHSYNSSKSYYSDNLDQYKESANISILTSKLIQ
jgi:hypothetical protein